jgi:hypothetical protein
VPSVFDKYGAIADQAVASLYGVTATVTPRLSARYEVARPDFDRDPFTIKGVLSLAPESVSIRGQKVGGEIATAARMSAGAAEFYITGADYAAAPSPIARGDLITIEGVAYAVAEVRVNDTPDRVLILTREDV